MFISIREREASKMSWKNSSVENSRKSPVPLYRAMPAWARAKVPQAKAEEEAVAVVEALVQEEAVARELGADPVLVVAEVRVREEEVKDNEDMCSHHGRGRHARGHLPALRQGSYFYHCRSG
jgi:hypothetical protein